MLKFIVIAAVPVIIIGLTNPGAAQSTSATTCPQHYEHMTGGLCFKASNGDVVLAEAPVIRQRFTSADCRKGYELMIDNLCLHPKWGDVVFAEKVAPTVAVASCPAGYVILVNGLCFNGVNGGITFAEVKDGSTLSAAQR